MPNPLIIMKEKLNLENLLKMEKNFSLLMLLI